MKKIISLLLVLVMVFSMTVFASAANPFEDTYYSKNREAIEALYGLGILEGYGNGKYGPGNTLTRAEACAIIVRAMVEDDLIYESRVDTFTDVDYFAWYRAYVDTAYRHDYMHGYGETFGPNDNVTYAQFATIVLNMLGYNCPQLPGEWPENAVEYAEYLNLYFKVSKHDNDDSIYREDAAQMLYNALDCYMVKWVNGKMVKTGETLGEYLIDNYYVYTAYIYDFDKQGDFIKYVLTDTTVGYCNWNEWDNRIENGDHVEISLDYLGRTVSVDFCHRPEVVTDNIVDIEGKVTDFDLYKNGDFKMIEIEGIVYDAINLNIDNVVSMDESKFDVGVYCRAYYNTNYVITKIEFVTNSNVPQNPVLPEDNSPNTMVSVIVKEGVTKDTAEAWYHTTAECDAFIRNELKTTTITFESIEDIPTTWHKCEECK